MTQLQVGIALQKKCWKIQQRVEFPGEKTALRRDEVGQSFAVLDGLLEGQSSWSEGAGEKAARVNPERRQE